MLRWRDGMLATSSHFFFVRWSSVSDCIFSVGWIWVLSSLSNRRIPIASSQQSSSWIKYMSFSHGSPSFGVWFWGRCSSQYQKQMIDPGSEEKVRRRVFKSSIYVARWNWPTRNFHQSIEEFRRQMISINRSDGTFRIHSCFFRGKELRGSFSRWAPDEKLNG